MPLIENGNRNLIGDGNWPFEKADKQQLPEDFEKEGPKCLSPEVGKPKGLMILPEDVVDDNLPSKIPIGSYVCCYSEQQGIPLLANCDMN